MCAFYVIRSVYIGTNEKEDEAFISTVPARKNMSKEICTNGWCGSFNDWSTYAHGQYKTAEEAEAFIMSEWGGREIETEDSDEIKRFKCGSYEALTRADTENYIYDAMTNDITAETTDERLAALGAEYECNANSEGLTLSDADRIMKKFRAWKIEEKEASESE